MGISVLVERLLDEPVLRSDLDALLEAKRAGQELDRGPRIDSISEFLERELERLSSARPERHARKDARLLDRTFLEILRTINGPSPLTDSPRESPSGAQILGQERREGEGLVPSRASAATMREGRSLASGGGRELTTATGDSVSTGLE